MQVSVANRSSILNSLDKRKQQIKPKLRREIERNESLSIVKLETEREFLELLIWHAIDATRFLTPDGKQRTLDYVAKRLKVPFKAVCDFQLIDRVVDPSWFITCYELDQEFDYEKFGYLFVRKPNEDERKQSPTGEHYICDGCHRSLVLARKLADKSLEYTDREIIVLPTVECPKSDT